MSLLIIARELISHVFVRLTERFNQTLITHMMKVA